MGTTSEPIIHGILELRIKEGSFFEFGKRVYEAQKSRWKNTGKRTGWSEGGYYKSPGYIYEWIVYNSSKIWMITTPGGDQVNIDPLMYVKVAFAYAAIYGENEYTTSLVNAATQLANNQYGFGEATLEDGSSALPLWSQRLSFYSDKTNQIILASALYALEQFSVAAPLSNLSPFVIEASSGAAWFIFGSSRYAPQGYAAEMDALSSQLVYGMCNNFQNYGYDYYSNLLLPNGKPDPSKIPSGSSIVLFGGPGAQRAVAYYENNRVWFNPNTPLEDQAPIKMGWNSTHYYFMDKFGVVIQESAIPKTDVWNGNVDEFILETFIDSNGRYVLIGYGFSRKGTNAAAFQLKYIYPNINQYQNSWYIFKWIDLNKDQVMTQNEVTLIATGN
jgi:hypothetical protein